MKVLLEQNNSASLTVEFVVVENSHTCVSVNLKSQRKMLQELQTCTIFFSRPQTQHNSYAFSNSSLPAPKSFSTNHKLRNSHARIFVTVAAVDAGSEYRGCEREKSRGQREA